MKISLWLVSKRLYKILHSLITKKMAIGFFSAMFGALLSFGGAICYYNFERSSFEDDIAAQIKWEVYENIADTYSEQRLNDRLASFDILNELDPNTSIQDGNLYYFAAPSLRADFFKTRVGDLSLLKKGVMNDTLNFYSLLNSVYERDQQLEKVFVSKVPLKIETVQKMINGVVSDTSRMRTMGAQVVGKIMYYYSNYDLGIRNIQNKNLTEDEILESLYNQVYFYVDNVESGDLISAYDVASSTNLFNRDVFQCDSDFVPCILATSHYLILKTGKVREDAEVYNGYIKK